MSITVRVRQYNTHLPGCHQYYNDKSLFPRLESSILMPFYSNLDDKIKFSLEAAMYNEPHWRWNICSESYEDVFEVFQSVLCQIVNANVMGINIQADRFRRCDSRKMTALSALRPQVLSKPGHFTKGNSLSVALSYYGSIDMDLRAKSGALALIHAYETLNNTLQLIKMNPWNEISEKNIDIIVTPYRGSLLNQEYLF